MSSRTKYVVFLLALVMSVTLVGASATVAVDRTVLDADHISDTVGQEGVYEELAADARENISEEIDGNLDENTDGVPTGITLEFDTERIATNAITEEYFAGEFERNFEQLIAFMEGETDELELWIDLSPVYESVIEQFTAEGVTVDTVTLTQQSEFQSQESGVEITDEMLAELNENEAGYQSVRTEIRRQGVEGVPVEFDDSGAVNVDTVTLTQETDFESNDGDIEITDAMIERLNEGPDGYGEVRSDIREQVRESLPARAGEQQVDQALREVNEDLKADAAQQARADYGGDVAETTLGDIIALQNTVIDGLTDPALDSFEEYESRRSSAETTLEASLEDEIETALQEANEEAKADATEQARTEYGDDVGDGTLEDIIALQNTVIDGLTDPALDSFEEYESRRETAEANLEEALAAEIRDDIREQVDEDRIDLGGEVNEDNDGISTVRSGTSLVGVLVVALPVLFLVLVGVVYAVTRSVRRTALTTGYTAIVAGGIGAVAGLVARGPVLDAIEPDVEAEEAAQAEFADAFVSLFESLFGALVTQSALVVVGGVGLVGVVYAERRGYLDTLTAESDPEESEEDGGSKSEETDEN